MSTTAELLSADGAILTDPGQVERALGEMWKEAGAAAVGGVAHAAATRVCVANLVVVAAEEQWNDVLEVLGELSPMYPTRTIALLMKDGQVSGPPLPPRCEGGEMVRASVSALCHVPQPGQPQVCCEQIILRASCAQSADLHRTVLPLLESDVPVMVWWTLDAGLCGELQRSLASESRRFILDAGLKGLARLPELLSPAGNGQDPPSLAGTEVGRTNANRADGDQSRGLLRRGVRELGWYRIHRWRELVASMFDQCGGVPLQCAEEVRVEIGDADGNVLDSALWLIAFLGGQLGWELRNTEELRIADRELRNENAALPKGGTLASFEFTAKQGTVRASVAVAPGAGLVGLVVKCGSNLFEARRGAEELRIIAHEEHVCQVPRVVHLPRLKRSEALASALAGRTVDAAFTRAVPLVAWMSSHAR